MRPQALHAAINVAMLAQRHHLDRSNVTSAL
jgi:hypothetical protein